MDQLSLLVRKYNDLLIVSHLHACSNVYEKAEGISGFARVASMMQNSAALLCLSVKNVVRGSFCPDDLVNLGTRFYFLKSG